MIVISISVIEVSFFPFRHVLVPNRITKGREREREGEKEEVAMEGERGGGGRGEEG